MSTPGDEVTARVFRSLYGAYDLHSVEVIYVVAPRATPYFAGSGLSEVARQISDRKQQTRRTE